jgi:hypothetical protein
MFVEFRCKSTSTRKSVEEKLRDIKMSVEASGLYRVLHTQTYNPTIVAPELDKSLLLLDEVKHS